MAETKVTINGETNAGGAWASWTPTTSNFDTTKATLDFAKYAQIGKTVHFKLQYSLTSNAVGSEPTFSLPVAAATGYASYARIGEATFNDPGIQTIYGPVLLKSTTQISAYAYATGATYLQFATISATAPFTWGNTDVIYMQGAYEAG